MIIDEVDYDTITSERQRHIFIQMASPKQVGQDAPTWENTRPVLSTNKDGEDMISTKTGEKKRSGAKAKKKFVALVVGKDISLAEVLGYLSSALVGRFCGKTPKISSFKTWTEINRNPMLGYTPSFHVLPRGRFLLKVSKDKDILLLL